MPVEWNQLIRKKKKKIAQNDTITFLSKPTFIILFILLSKLFLSHAIFSQEYINTPPFQAIIPNAEIQIYLYEDFSDKIFWHYQEYDSSSVILRFTNPLKIIEDNKKKQYLNKLANVEKEIIQKNKEHFYYNNQLDEKNSLTIQATVKTPNKGNILLTKYTKNRDKRIDGEPIFLSLWVHGFQQNHKLYAVFCNKNYDSIPIYIGTLDFLGWNRLELPIRNVAFTNEKILYKQQFCFQGFKIQSSKKLNERNIIFQFARVLFMIHHRNSKYTPELERF